MDFAAAIKTDPLSLHALAGLKENPCPNLPILTAKVKLTWRCNLSCVFCGLPEPRMTMTRQSALALGRELASQGLRKVHFSGGEVLTHPECFDIFSDWAGLGVQVNLTSNGFLMDKERIKLLEESRVHSVSLSIDSADRRIHDKLRGRKGAYKTVMRAAERISARGRIKLRVNTVATSRNIAGLPELRNLIHAIGDNISWKIIPVDPIRRSLLPSIEAIKDTAAMIGEWTELEDRSPFGATDLQFRESSLGRHGFRKGPCFAPWFNLFFAPDGACYSCCMTRGKMAPLGSYPGQSVSEIIDSSAMREFRSLIASGKKHHACISCDDFLDEGRIINDLLVGMDRT